VLQVKIAGIIAAVEEELLHHPMATIDRQCTAGVAQRRSV
jgi:hypothetical protein